MAGSFDDGVRLNFDRLSILSYLQAILLGIVQGLTEFLPVSSSGHLVILQERFNLEPESAPMILFDLAVGFSHGNRPVHAAGGAAVDVDDLSGEERGGVGR